MNTSDKGEDFELRVLASLTRALRLNRLGLLPEACQIHHRKSYYSRDRESEIQVDISIEVYLPGATTWSFLWVWECKDYKGSIPVDDVEEFWAKLQQIAGVNVKGSLAVSGGLQKSAIAFARSKGMAVVRILPEGQFSPILYDVDERATVEDWRGIRMRETLNALVTPKFYGSALYALYANESFPSWMELVAAVISELPIVDRVSGEFIMDLHDIFTFPEKGEVVLTGLIQNGSVRAGDLVEFVENCAVTSTAVISRVEIFRRELPEGVAGDNVGLVLRDHSEESKFAAVDRRVLCVQPASEDGQPARLVALAGGGPGARGPEVRGPVGEID